MSGPGRAAELLASHLDQRRRLGEPGIVPDSVSARQLVELLRAGRAAASPARGDAAATPQAPTGQGQAPQPPASRAGRPQGGQPRADAKPGLPTYDGYEELRDLALACTRCGLADTRRHVVFSDGNPNARLMVVGEAPGAQEDRTGLPFVGQAGKLLDLMLASVGLSRRDSVYICNVLKCRPPGNRDPSGTEIASCNPFLAGQIELVKPEAILAVGRFAGHWLTKESRPLNRLRGKVRSYHGLPLVVTYHPAALLRNPGLSRPAWEDLQLLCGALDGATE